MLKNKNSKNNKPIVRKDNTNKVIEKELALLETLQHAESRQLESFIKNRSKELDNDINKLRTKLKLTDTLSIEDHDLNMKVASNDLNVKGYGLGRVEFNEESINLNKTKLKNSIRDVDLNSSKVINEPRNIKDQLITILARIKLRMEDMNMSTAELRELLLPSDLVLPDEHCIPIREFIGVLQTDLVMPITKNDQVLILNTYASTRKGGGSDDNNDEVNVKNILLDAGVWYEGKTSSSMVSPDRKRYDNESTHDDYIDQSTSPTSYHKNNRLSPEQLGTSPLRRLLDDNTRYSNNNNTNNRRHDKQEKTLDMLDLSSRNLDDLAELHQLILDEKDYDAIGDNISSSHYPHNNNNRNNKPMNNNHANEEHKEVKKQYYDTNITNNQDKKHKLVLTEDDMQDAFDNNTTTNNNNNKSMKEEKKNDNDDDYINIDTTDLHTLDRMNALKKENDRLKKEIGSFDTEFFEQLEDLKYRYTRLQEIVGEDPTRNLGNPITDPRIRGGGLPLDRLSWSVRNSMTAMDRAGLTSPLVSRPISSKNNNANMATNAYTYAPGMKLNSDNHGRGLHIGGSIPTTTTTPTRNNYTSSSQYPVLDTISSQYPLPLAHVGSSSSLGGGYHGIGAGTHSFVPDEAGGTFSNLCERRLAFELSQHLAPEQATRSLIHRVIEVSGKNNGFITCPQLVQIFHSVNLKMSPEEIEMLATGFASNAKGGINAIEFCETVKTLLYNLIGEHASRWGEKQARVNGVNQLNSENEKVKSDKLHQLLTEISEEIIAHDRRAVIGNSKNLFKTLLRPFVEYDTDGSGLTNFHTFSEILKDIGCMLTHQDLLTVAKSFMISPLVDTTIASSHPSSNLNHIQSFRDAKLRGTLKGVAKTQPVLGDWLATSGIGLEDYYGDRNGVSLGNKDNIDYTSFVTELSEVLLTLLEKNGGVVLGTKFPWILKEFEFVDTLINQLEEMKPTQRRKVLMSLQYALSSADPKQDCDLDGFTVLNALLSSGFRLQRVNRVRLLRAVEELGGKMDYRDLCQVLLNSCADWTAEEKHVVQKILKSMGVTVIERRNWLARLKQTLNQASARMAKKSGRWFASESTHEEDGMSNNDHMMTAIPPATFLHCLRDCNVILNVDEEATLLDCLDTERLAKLGQLEIEQGPGRKKTGSTNSDNWSIPTIQYEAFLQFCSRHCGTWIDAAPEVHEAVRWAMKSISNVVLAIHEFASLLHAFDEVIIGSVSKRAFQICCHRSRLFANLPEESINTMSEILTIDGGGKVDYTSFIVYLRSTSSHISNIDNDNNDPSQVVSIIDQLVRNSTDTKGTILPLRNWLMHHTDMETFLLTRKDMNSLLREFSVMYRPEDLEALIMDVGRNVKLNENLTSSRRSNNNTQLDMDLDQTIGQTLLKKQVVDARDLMIHILQSRPRWMMNHPYLCQRMLKAMQVSGNSKLGISISNNNHNEGGSSNSVRQGTYDSNGNTGDVHRSHMKVIGGTRGVETAVARKILTRLRAFAGRGRSTSTGGGLDNETKARDSNNLMVERDIFKHLTSVTGLSLSDEDVLILADATDFLPEASRVRCDVILEALMGNTNTGNCLEDGTIVIDSTTVGTPLKIDQSEAGIYALDHLRDLLWKHAARLHRTSLQWIADVRTVFAGFDKGKTGFITTEDFNMALWLLNATVAQDILQDISYYPEGPGLVDYTEILKYVLVPPKREKQIETIDKNKSSKRCDTCKDDNDTLKTRLQKKTSKDSPIQSLINVIRKSLHHFIVSDHTLETAWICLLKAFQRFDPQETNQVNPRDFCLAVSVLLNGDEIILTKSEWAMIIDHFTSLNNDNNNNNNNQSMSLENKKRQTDFLGGAMVDYMLFCETILNPNDIKNRLYELKKHKGVVGGSSRLDYDTTTIMTADQIDHSKRFLSKSIHNNNHNNTYTNKENTNTFNSLSATTGGIHSYGNKEHSRTSSSSSSPTRKGGLSRGKPSYSTNNGNSSSSHSLALQGQPYVFGTSGTKGSTYDNNSNHRNDKVHGLYVDPQDDEILKRFKEASLVRSSSNNNHSPTTTTNNIDRSHKYSGGGSSGYNNAGGTATNTNNSFTTTKSPWNTDNLYRTLRSQEDANRASSRGSKDVRLTNNKTVPISRNSRWNM